MVHKEDVDNVIRLIYESLLQVQVDQDFRNVK
jgi:DNA replicative helicase MCM subunit Mcm2 (Cdc46/Mcm family)